MCCSDDSDSVNEFLWKEKGHKSRKGATGEDLSDIYKDYSLPSGMHSLNIIHVVYALSKQCFSADFKHFLYSEIKIFCILVVKII